MNDPGGDGSTDQFVWWEKSLLPAKQHEIHQAVWAEVSSCNQRVGGFCLLAACKAAKESEEKPAGSLLAACEKGAHLATSAG